jgi:recombination protein RecT
VERDDDFADVDIIAEDVKYDIEQNANIQEFPMEHEPEVNQVIEPSEPVPAADKSWMED